MHYLYLAAPVNFTQEHCAQYQRFLESKLSQGGRGGGDNVIHSVTLCMKENLYGFQGNQLSPYLKVSITDPKHAGRVRGLIERGEANWQGMWRGADGGIMTFDNIQYIMRFMVDAKVRVPTRILAIICLKGLKGDADVRVFWCARCLECLGWR